MKKLIIPLIIFISACGGNEESPIQEEGTLSSEETSIDPGISNYLGNYYIVEKNEESGKFIRVENCWSKTVEMFELSEFAGSPGSYYFAFHAHHSDMFLLQKAYYVDDLNFAIEGTYEDERTDEVQRYIIALDGDDMLKIKQGEYEPNYAVKEGQKDKYELIPCNERRELSDLDYMNKIFMTFFALRDGGETLKPYIPKEGIEFIKPGPGVSPIESVLHNVDDVKATGLFNTPVYDRLMEYVQMANNEEGSFLDFVSELPDRCMPEKETIFVKTVDLEDYTKPLEGTAMLTKMNNELDEVYTYFILYYEFKDHMIIKKIDATECGL